MQKNLTMGRYSQMRKQFLKENHRVIYYNYLTKGTLQKHLSDIENRAKVMEEQLMKQMSEQEGLTEELKAADQMAWVQSMNNLKSRVQEIVMNEVVYSL
ncbi:MAG: TnpV protein [Eubacterium sp.]